MPDSLPAQAAALVRDPHPDAALRAFARDGYLVVRGLAPPEALDGMTEAVAQALDPLVGPAEFEADVGYPGAPADRAARGGDTPRRLLHAYARGGAFRRWAMDAGVLATLGRLRGARHMLLSQCHHNCIMTKHPGHGSATLWHHDIRYWSFERPELVSVWLALGPETTANGALWVIPGSHLLHVGRGRLDRDLFLRPEVPDNSALIASAVPLELDAGDVLFFHCRLFHAAGRNDTDRVKFSVVFTYHDAGNLPIPGTRSARYPSIAP